jgi:5-methylcytosine-specific restriction endonuclease McrBC regulatory subunit McrC
MLVRLPERGSLDLELAAWLSLSQHAAFWRLFEKGILSVSTLPGNKVRLSASCYVGRASFGGIDVQVVEKVKNSLSALIKFASRDAFRIENLGAPASELGPLISLLTEQFLKCLRTYVSHGREARYATKQSIGSLVGGRLDLTRSLQLRARGLGHLLAFDKNVLQRNTPKNRVLLVTLLEIERLSKIVALPAEQMVATRSLARLFDDCRDAEVLFARRESFIQSAEQIIEESNSTTEKDLLALAQVTLAHESFEHGATTLGTSPRAWFLNLENLFERAVREVIRNTVQPYGLSVTGSPRPQKPIFATEPVKYTANPDLVIGNGSAVVGIGDVKYKSWSGAASADDIYQLLVHAATFGSSVGFLVFPGESLEIHELGFSSTGCRTWLFVVDVRALEEHLKNSFSVLGLTPTMSANLRTGTR